MDSGKKLDKLNSSKLSSGKWRWLWLVVGLIVLGGAGGWFLLRQKDVGKAATFTVRRGNLPITVLQGGTIKSLKSQQIRSEF
jgi:hypothetical protein